MELSVSQKSKSLIILVHGTWADVTGWVSNGSFFTNTLIDKIGSNNFQIKQFGWSGKNSLYERQLASIELIKMINDSSLVYNSIHLIGHSHGGSVIRGIFAQNNLEGIKLKKPASITSITTMGTPFIFYKGNWKHLKIFKNFTFYIILIASLLATYANVYVAVNNDLKTWSVIRIIGMTLLFIYMIALPTIGYLVKFYHAKSYNRLLNSAFQNNKIKWLLIYSKYDEAILSIRRAINTSFTLNNRSLRRGYWGSGLLLAPIFLYNFFYNLIVRPIIDKIVNGRMVNMATGNDRIFYKVKKCSFHPESDDLISSLSPELENSLFHRVNQNISKIIGPARFKLLQEDAKLNELLEIEKEIMETNQLGEDEPLLIHSTYMVQTPIIEKIAAFIIEKERESVIPNVSY